MFYKTSENINSEITVALSWVPLFFEPKHCKYIVHKWEEITQVYQFSLKKNAWKFNFFII